MEVIQFLSVALTAPDSVPVTVDLVYEYPGL